MWFQLTAQSESILFSTSEEEQLEQLEEQLDLEKRLDLDRGLLGDPTIRWGQKFPKDQVSQSGPSQIFQPLQFNFKNGGE